jgi:hypothetical protein
VERESEWGRRKVGVLPKYPYFKIWIVENVPM